MFHRASSIVARPPPRPPRYGCMVLSGRNVYKGAGSRAQSCTPTQDRCPKSKLSASTFHRTVARDLALRVRRGPRQASQSKKTRFVSFLPKMCKEHGDKYGSEIGNWHLWAFIFSRLWLYTHLFELKKTFHKKGKRVRPFQCTFFPFRRVTDPPLHPILPFFCVSSFINQQYPTYN